MKFSRLLSNPILVMFVIVAFSFFATGCTKTVTKYDKDGKPYTEQEFDPVASLAAVVLWTIGLAALAAAAADSSFLNEESPMFAFAKNQDVASDALPDMDKGARLIRIVDSQGNLLSEHMIQPDRLRFGERIINSHEIQDCTKINEKVLKNFAYNIAKANNLNSIPKSIKADVSWLPDESDVLKINAVSVPQVTTDSDSRASELIVATEQGFYRVTSVPDGNGHISVTVSQLNNEPARNFTY